eukprot:8330028-Pyramimonas_sp.AAC.1
MLFIAVMEVWLRALKKRWRGQRRTGSYYGFVIDSVDGPLTNLRFADDVLLLASSKSDVVKMPRDLTKEASRYVLVVHFGKTALLAHSADNCSLTV